MNGEELITEIADQIAESQYGSDKKFMHDRAKERNRAAARFIITKVQQFVIEDMLVLLENEEAQLAEDHGRWLRLYALSKSIHIPVE